MIILAVKLIGAFLVVCLLGVVRRYRRRRYLCMRGKHVCITGGSKGIGFSIAQECIRRGATVVTLIARNPHELESAVEKLITTADACSWFAPRTSYQNGEISQERSCVIRGFSCDVTDAAAVTRVFKVINGIELDKFSSSSDVGEPAETAIKKAGLVKVKTTSDTYIPETVQDIDVLVNCAGVCICDDFDSLQPHELREQVILNVCGTLHPCQEMLKSIKMKMDTSEACTPNKAIILVGSMASQLNIFGFVAYGASKFAIRGIWEALTMECESLGIRVICAFPPNTVLHEQEGAFTLYHTPGFEIECRRKPEITKVIEDIAGLYSPDEVAKGVINAIEQGARRVTFGYLGWLLTALTSGFAPASDIFEAISDFIVLPFAKLMAIGLSYYWLHVVKKHKMESKTDRKPKQL